MPLDAGCFLFGPCRSPVCQLAWKPVDDPGQGYGGKQSQQFCEVHLHRHDPMHEAYQSQLGGLTLKARCVVRMCHSGASNMTGLASRTVGSEQLVGF